MKHPITIIGGGLSGLALGCYLQKHAVQVTIIEQGKYPRHKVCGEFICGVSNHTLKELGIQALFKHAETIENIKWHIADTLVLNKQLPNHGTGISRHLLDDELQKLFTKLGGTIHQKRIHKADFAAKNIEGIIWASGKEKQAHSKNTKQWIGIKAHIENMPIDGLEMHTGGNPANGGYIGLSPIEDNKINACGLFEVDKNISGKGSLLLKNYLTSIGLNKLNNRINKASIVDQSFSTVAGFSMGRQKSLKNNKTNTLPIGDAAILIPPFTGNGMSIALESALLAGKCLLPYCRGEQNADWQQTTAKYHSIIQKKFRKRLIAAKCIHPFFFRKSGRWILSSLAKTNLIPFRSLFSLLR